MFLLLWFCYVVWGLMLWYLQNCFLLTISLAMSHFIQYLKLPQQVAVTILRLQIRKPRLREINCPVHFRRTEAQTQVFFRRQKLEEVWRMPRMSYCVLLGYPMLLWLQFPHYYLNGLGITWDFFIILWLSDSALRKMNCGSQKTTPWGLCTEGVT